MKPDEIELLKYRIDHEARLLGKVNQDEKKYVKTIVLLIGLCLGYAIGFGIGLYVGR